MPAPPDGPNAVDGPEAGEVTSTSAGPLYGGFPTHPIQEDAGDGDPDGTVAGGGTTAASDANAAGDEPSGTDGGADGSSGDEPSGTDGGADGSSDGARRDAEPGAGTTDAASND
jgi:hypothetical protein